MSRRNPNYGKKKRQIREQEKPKVRVAPQDQIKNLDYRLGEGVGAVKERKRLAKLIEHEEIPF